jgi:uncharacterized protein YndB with AHSA1/START domain
VRVFASKRKTVVQHLVGRKRLPTLPSWLVSAGDMHGFFIVDPNNWPAFCFASSPYKEGEIMATVQTSINISAPVEKVFAYVTDPMTVTDWMVGMMEVSNVTGSGASLRYNWKYKMAGVPLRGESTRNEYVPNERLVSENKEGIRSTFAFTFAPHEGGTKLEMKVDYTIPIPVLGKLAEKLVLKRNEREADLWMENIKDNMEG